MKDVIKFYFLNYVTTYMISRFCVALNGNDKLNGMKLFKYLNKVRMGGKTRDETIREARSYSV